MSRNENQLLALTTDERTELERLIRKVNAPHLGWKGLPEYELPPAELVEAMKQRLAPFLAPARPVEVAKAVAILFGSYPRPAVEHAEVFTQSLVMELASYPPDVLFEMIRTARRTLKFFPSIAELVAIADKLMESRVGGKHRLDHFDEQWRKRAARSLHWKEQQRRERNGEECAPLCSETISGCGRPSQGC